MTGSNIDIKGLNIKFRTKNGEIRAIKDLDITFEHGKITGIIGESGSGKSLLGMSILQLLSNEARVSGRCIYNGENLYKVDHKRLRQVRGKEIGFVAQNPINALNPVLTIRRQLVEHTVLHLGIKRQLAEKLCSEYLTSFGLENPRRLLKSYPYQLSGGMNQVVLIVMGVICNPDFVVVDEPTKGLDSKIRKSTYDHLRHIKEHYVKSMILITHDIYFASKLCEEIVVMYKGEIVEIGNRNDVIINPKHPYTQGLINSTVKNGMVAIERIDEITSEQGCSFYPFCKKRRDNCLSRVALKAVGTSKVRCIL